MTEVLRPDPRPMSVAALREVDGSARTVDVAGHSLEVVQVNAAVTAVNIESLMRPGWQNLLVAESTFLGKEVDLTGGAVATSREKADFVTRYTVVEGNKIRNNMPWVNDLWEGPIRELVTKITGEEVKIDDELDEKGNLHGLNINVTDRDNQKSGYERHTDFNKYTALIAGTDIKGGDGGELVMDMNDGTLAEIRIQAGWVYIFNGSEHEHGVKKLTPQGPKYRITIPMDYVPLDWEKKRPEGLSKVLGSEEPETNGHHVNGATVHELFPKPDGPDTPDSPTPNAPGRKAS